MPVSRKEQDPPNREPGAAPQRSPHRRKSGSRDVVLVHGPTEDGKGARVLRRRGRRLEAGEVRPVQDGQPLQGDLVRLHPCENSPLLYDVEVQYEAPRDAASQTDGASRPAQVSTATYRRGWDSIWGGSKKATQNKLN